MSKKEQIKFNKNRTVLSYKDQIALNTPPQTVWNLIKVFDGIHNWHPATADAVLLVGENGKPLAVREFQLVGGGFVISELLEYKERTRWYKYRIIKTNLPLINYVGEMSVVEGEGGGCIVHWSARFQRPHDEAQIGMDDAATSQLVQAVFTGGLQNLDVITKK